MTAIDAMDWLRLISYSTSIINSCRSYCSQLYRMLLQLMLMMQLRTVIMSTNII